MRRLVLGATRSQLQVLQHPARFVSVFASRRWGKTTCAESKLIAAAGTPRTDGVLWWVAPTYRQARKPFRMLCSALSKTGLIASASRSELSISFRTGWRIDFRSADVPDNLRGEGVHGMVVDEAAQISDETWHDCLRPTLADTGGWLLAIGTPRGRRGWMYQMYVRGQDPGEPAYKGFHFTALDAIFIPPSELEEAKRTMPRRAFEQEFMAGFLDGVGTVFPGVRDRARLTPLAGEPLGIGVDWAKKVDLTWFVAVGATSGALVECYRAPRFAYPRQVELLGEFIARQKARAGGRVAVVHDRTGVGEALDDLLAGARIKAEGFTFTESSKRELVEEAAVDFESNRLGFVAGAERDDAYAALIREHEDYTVTLTKTGKATYGAPEGLHDDAVSATMLANRARRELWRAGALNRPKVSYA